MQTRRAFLASTTVTLLLIPLASAACTSSGPMRAGNGSCNGVQTTSSVALSHTHTLCVPSTDLADPQAGGMTYTTSGPDPTHTVTLTQAQLQAIEAGQTVNVTTSVAASHTHDFAIRKTSV